MKEINFFVSPHYSEEVFEDKVSGKTFAKSDNITVYSVKMKEEEMVGLMEGFRKNFLFPYDRQTQKLVNEFKMPAAKARVQEPVVEAVPEVAVAEEAPVVKEAPKKKQSKGKRQPKKAEESTKESK